jgi:hypothetical protein
MEQLNEIASIIALTMGAAWAAGINLYAAILVLGILGNTGNINLPPDLQILMDPLVLGAAGIMYAVEFFADKVPGVDNGWDALHTFIRIPAGALMAAGAVGDINPAVAMAAAILGGGIAAGTHAAKAGTRVIINASPEPFSNIAASLAEDIAVIFGLWVALQHPWFFMILMVVFLIFLAWVLPKIWRAIKAVFSRIARFFKGEKKTENPTSLMTNHKKIEH